MTDPQPADLEDIQGLVYSAWTQHRHAGYLFATLGDHAGRSRAWLEAARHDVTPAARHGRRRLYRLQIALSATGLAALGVPADVRDALPPEVQAGMASRRRALADTDPTTWQLGGSSARIDVLVMVFAPTAAALATELDHRRDALVAAGARICADERTEPLHEHEHFGFADGLAQPFVPGLNPRPRPGEDRIPAGEILLGYENAYGQHPHTPIWHDFDLGKNGSFLVFRKLQQHVATFWGWIAQHARTLAGDDPEAAAYLTELLAAKLIGRWRSGAPLVLAPDHDDPALAVPDRRNSFKYLVEDPDGLRCPISAHIRRANPRDARGGTAEDSETVVNRHRILRRGRSYGTRLPDHAARAGRDDGVPRGLYFLSLQASIARGFEFIQQTWLANPGFNGLHREPDPLIGRKPDQGTHLTIPGDPLRLRLAEVPAVVTNVGGEYFLLPSLSALARIAAGP